MPAGVRTAVVFSTRDKTWTDDAGVTHRLVGFRRTACVSYYDQIEDLRDKTPWQQPDCILCLCAQETPSFAILQEANPDDLDA